MIGSKLGGDTRYQLSSRAGSANLCPVLFRSCWPTRFYRWRRAQARCLIYALAWRAVGWKQLALDSTPKISLPNAGKARSIGLLTTLGHVARSRSWRLELAECQVQAARNNELGQAGARWRKICETKERQVNNWYPLEGAG